MAECKANVRVEVINMSKGMTTCRVCGRDFALMAEEHYVTQDPRQVGAFANLVSTDRAFEYDAFDCPHCGCQNIIQDRKPVYLGQDVCDNEEDVPEFTSCDECKYADKSIDEMPCADCVHAHTISGGIGNFEPKEDKQ